MTVRNFEIVLVMVPEGCSDSVLSVAGDDCPRAKMQLRASDQEHPSGFDWMGKRLAEGLEEDLRKRGFPNA